MTSRFFNRTAVIVISILTLTVFIGSPSMVIANSESISYSYKARKEIVVGSLVSLDGGTDQFVTLANSKNAPKLVGITVGVDDSLLAVNAGEGLAQVAMSGRAPALVSTVNGEISVGDQIAVSPFNGIGMKSLPGSRLIGVAQSSLNSSDEGLISRKVRDTDGKLQNIKIGMVNVAISIGTAPKVSEANRTGSVQEFVESIAGHSVSRTRIIVSGIIFIVTIVGLAALIYSSIYGTIIAVGRNPLARASIYRTLRTVMIMALLVAMTSSFVIFLILR